MDEQEWPFVLLVHELYASLRSFAAVERALESDHGLRMGRGTLHRILRDRRYLTGEITTKDPTSESGSRVDIVPLARPVPRALWEHNQMLLAVKRGKSIKTPEGVGR